MGGNFSYTPPDQSFGTAAAQVGVFFYDSSQPDGERYTIIPNAECTEIQFRDGHEPPTAHFSYIIDDRATSSDFPNQIEQLWPLNLPDPNLIGQYIVDSGDRVVVLAALPDGSVRVLFDGFVRVPQADVSSEQQHVGFGATGVAIRNWDLPIQGRVQRSADPDSINESDGSADVATNLPTVFNPSDATHPSGLPNCTTDGNDTGEDDPTSSYPVFIEANLDRSPDPRTLWTLSKCVRYLLGVCNPPTPDDSGPVPLDPEQDDDSPDNPEDIPVVDTYEQFTSNPDFTALDNLLDNRQPTDGNEFYNPANSSTYTANPIVVREFDCTNMAWPDALERLLGYHGFGMRWTLSQDDNDQPVNSFAIYRKDAGNAIAPKQFYMPAAGSQLDPSQPNIADLSASFDYHGLANEFAVEMAPTRYEASFILAPAFQPSSDDSTATSRTQFFSSNLGTASETVRAKYRKYIFDECGDGHWNQSSTSWVMTAGDFTPIFPAQQSNDGTGGSSATFVNRYRPGATRLLTDDGSGDRYRCQLSLSRDYMGPAPAVWDGKTGHWQPITRDFKPLDDQLGVEFTCEDPEKIHIGKYTGSDPQQAGEILKGITSIANPGTEQGTKYFYLMLTTVVEGDQGSEVIAPRRYASPLRSTVRRRIECGDHWRKDVVTPSSIFFTPAIAAYYAQVIAAALTGADVVKPTFDDSGNIVVRDDTDSASDYAAQMRAAHEFPPIPMSVTLPGIILSYQIGDRIDWIYGRNISLQANAGSEQNEAPSYPFIVGISISLASGQTTTLQLTDRRLEPAPIESRHRKR